MMLFLDRVIVIAKPPLNRLHRFPVASIMLASVVVGCAKKPAPPPIVEAGGVVTVDGAPLPRASVRFIPMFQGFGAEVIAESVTDENGRFQLTCSGSNGACVGPHRVIIEEGPLPPGTSGESVAAQMKMTAYLKSLPNRPIPENYGNLAQTPLLIDIVPEKNTYDLKLKR